MATRKTLKDIPASNNPSTSSTGDTEQNKRRELWSVYCKYKYNIQLIDGIVYLPEMVSPEDHKYAEYARTFKEAHPSAYSKVDHFIKSIRKECDKKSDNVPQSVPKSDHSNIYKAALMIQEDRKLLNYAIYCRLVYPDSYQQFEDLEKKKKRKCRNKSKALK